MISEFRLSFTHNEKNLDFFKNNIENLNLKYK